MRLRRSVGEWVGVGVGDGDAERVREGERVSEKVGRRLREGLTDEGE